MDKPIVNGVIEDRTRKTIGKSSHLGRRRHLEFRLPIRTSRDCNARWMERSLRAIGPSQEDDFGAHLAIGLAGLGRPTPGLVDVFRILEYFLRY